MGEIRSGGLEGAAAHRRGVERVRVGQSQVRKAGTVAGDAWSNHLPGAGFQVGTQTADGLIREGLSRSVHGCGCMNVHLIKGRAIHPIFT